MSVPNKTGRPRRAVLGVEQLENRDLMSVSVTPSHISLLTINLGLGVFSGRLVSDTAVAKVLLLTPDTLLVTVRQGTTIRNLTGKAVARRHVDLNGDDTPDLVAVFRRKSLRGVHMGRAIVTVSNGVLSESTRIAITF